MAGTRGAPCPRTYVWISRELTSSPVSLSLSGPARKIQLRWVQGRMASPESHRQIVASETEATASLATKFPSVRTQQPRGRTEEVTSGLCSRTGEDWACSS